MLFQNFFKFIYLIASITAQVHGSPIDLGLDHLRSIIDKRTCSSEQQNTLIGDSANDLISVLTPDVFPPGLAVDDHLLSLTLSDGRQYLGGVLGANVICKSSANTEPIASNDITSFLTPIVQAMYVGGSTRIDAHPNGQAGGFISDNVVLSLQNHKAKVNTFGMAIGALTPSCMMQNGNVGLVQNSLSSVDAVAFFRTAQQFIAPGTPSQIWVSFIPINTADTYYAILLSNRSDLSDMICLEH